MLGGNLYYRILKITCSCFFGSSNKKNWKDERKYFNLLMLCIRKYSWYNQDFIIAFYDFGFFLIGVLTPSLWFLPLEVIIFLNPLLPGFIIPKKLKSSNQKSFFLLEGFVGWKFLIRNLFSINGFGLVISLPSFPRIAIRDENKFFQSTRIRILFLCIPTQFW